MKSLLTILSLFALSCTFAQQQTGNFDYLTTNRRFTIAGRTVKGISNDSIWLIASADSLVTQYAVKGYVDNHFGPGTSNAYNFNPEQFIVSGYDVSIRFPQDPGEPLFSNSASFNFTQRHLNFLDSLMLAVGEDTYLDDRDFYYSPDAPHPIRTKSFTLTTDGTGAASWDSVNKRLNIPVSSGGGGGSSSPYHLPYNGNANYYLAGDSGLHPLPVTDTSSLSSRIDSKLNTSDTTGKWLPIGTFIPAAYVGDSIDYSFTSMTTIYNEAGPGEYTISSSDVLFNKDNLQNPFRQLKALDVAGWNIGSYVSFKNTGNVNSTAYTFLRGFVRLKQAVPIIQSLSFRFYNNGVPVSQILSMVNYGLDKSKINTYQNITIPMSAFQFSSNTFNEVRLIFGGGSSSDGLYLDLFQFQNATVNENIYVTDVFRVPGSTQVKKILGGQTVDAYTDSVGIATDTTPLHNQLLQQLAAIQNNTASILLKLNISDTAAMLSPYANKIAANTIAIAGKEPLITAGTTSQYWRGDKTWQTLSTTAVAEGTNLYYTDTRARAALTLTTTGTSGAATYNSTTGVLNVPQYASTSGWSLSGNAINPATDFIGTTSNNSFRIRTNNTERMVVDSVGNVRIGVETSSSTATPIKLSLGGTNSSNAAGSANNLKLLIYKDPTFSFGLGMSSGQMELQANSGSIVFYSGGTETLKVTGTKVSTNQQLSLGTTVANTKLALYDGSGSLYGLGIQANQFRLHLNGTSNLEKFSFLTSAAGSEIFAIQGGSNSRGVVLVPMTKAQRDLIPTPTQGQMVFVSDNGGYLSTYNAGWQKVTTTADP